MSTDRKDVNGKHNPLLMPIEADKAFSEVSDYGNQKYGNRDSWKNNTAEEGITKYVAAAVRHGKAYAQTGELDSESGLAHVKHLLWNAAAACWHYERLVEERGTARKRHPLDYFQHYEPGQIVPGKPQWQDQQPGPYVPGKPF